MKKWLLLLLLTFNTSASCLLDEDGINSVIVNDMLGHVVDKSSIMARVLKKDGYENYLEFSSDNRYSDALKQLTLLDEDDKNIVTKVHLEQSIDQLKRLFIGCNEKDLKGQLQFLMDDNYDKYREAMRGENVQVEQLLSAILNDI